jgi:hypothetical protein
MSVVKPKQKKRTLLHDEPSIVLQPEMVRRLGNLTDAAVLQQLNYWMPHAKVEHQGRRWVFKTHENWSKEIGITPHQVRRAMDRLEAIGLVMSCTPRGRTKHYAINYEHAMLDGAESPDTNAAELPDDGANLPDDGAELPAYKDLHETKDEKNLADKPPEVSQERPTTCSKPSPKSAASPSTASPAPHAANSTKPSKNSAKSKPPPNRSTTKPRHTAPNTPTPPSPPPPSPNTGHHSPSSNANSNAHPYGTPTSHRSSTDGPLLVLPRICGRSPTVQNQPGRNRHRTASTQNAPSSMRIPMGHPPHRTVRLTPIPQDTSRATNPPPRPPTRRPVPHPHCTNRTTALHSPATSRTEPQDR